MMLPISGSEYEAVAGLECVACFDAGGSWIGAEQGIDRVPAIGVMSRAGGENEVLQFDQLCKEWVGHGVAGEVRQVGGARVLVGVWFTLGRQVGESVGVDVVGLCEMESPGKEVHRLDEFACCSPNGIGNGNGGIVTRRQYECIEQRSEERR